MKQRLIFIALTFLTTFKIFGQDRKSTDFFNSIKTYNISKLIQADSFYRQDDNDMFEFPEPLGFIGDSFQRFYIHYTSITKDSKNPYQYLVSGKTKVKNNICSFKGTITITSAKKFIESENNDYKQGSFTSEIKLYEDSTQNHSGFFKGTMTTNFCLTKKNKIQYDALVFYGDGFSNNQFIGNWTDYKTKKSKMCNWGDFRIPNSKGLDIGAGEFSVADEYVKFGWQNYRTAYTETETKKAKQAQKIEHQKWWK